MDTTFFTLDQARQHAAETHQRCLALAGRTRHQLIFSHITLLELRGMTLKLSTSLSIDKLHVTVDAMGKKSRLLGAQEHLWTPPMSVSMIDDIIAGVSVEQAICQIAPFTTQNSLTMAMDWLTCNNAELRQTTHEALSDHIYGIGSFRGCRQCKAALERSVGGTDSPKESALRLHAVDSGLPCPEVNYPIFDQLELITHSVDMAYPEEHVIIEYDGEYHYNKSRWQYDLHKRNRLQDMGWTVLVAVNSDLATPQATDRFIRMVARALRRL